LSGLADRRVKMNPPYEAPRPIVTEYPAPAPAAGTPLGDCTTGRSIRDRMRVHGFDQRRIRECLIAQAKCFVGHAAAAQQITRLHSGRLEHRLDGGNARRRTHIIDYLRFKTARPTRSSTLREVAQLGCARR
jgi:hypothetical protein